MSSVYIWIILRVCYTQIPNYGNSSCPIHKVGEISITGIKQQKNKFVMNDRSIYSCHYVQKFICVWFEKMIWHNGRPGAPFTNMV